MCEGDEGWRLEGRSRGGSGVDDGYGGAREKGGGRGEGGGGWGVVYV